MLVNQPRQFQKGANPFGGPGFLKVSPGTQAKLAVSQNSYFYSKEHKKHYKQTPASSSSGSDLVLVPSGPPMSHYAFFQYPFFLFGNRGSHHDDVGLGGLRGKG